MSVEGRRTIFNIDICEIIEQASNMNNRLSKKLEQEILSDVDSETMQAIEIFLVEATCRYKLMVMEEKTKQVQTDWNPEWGNKPDA